MTADPEHKPPPDAPTSSEPDTAEQRPGLRLVSQQTAETTLSSWSTPDPDQQPSRPPGDTADNQDVSARDIDKSPTQPSGLAPLDVRLREYIGDILRARPRWSERPPSLSESWDYSASGDWTADEKSLRRVLHGLCVVIAFVTLYPIAWIAQAGLKKPIGFVLTATTIFLAHKAF